MIWDVHCHFPRNWDDPDSDEHERLIDARADALRDAGVTRASVLSGGPPSSAPRTTTRCRTCAATRT